MKFRIAAAAAALIAFASPTYAAEVIATDTLFPVGAFYASNTNGSGLLAPGGQTASMSTPGDYVTNWGYYPSLNTLTGVSTVFSIDNQLLAGESLTFETWVNGNVVGTWSVDSCSQCGTQDLDIALSFAPMSEFPYPQTYWTIYFVLASATPGVAGEVSFHQGGELTYFGLASGVPELHTWALLIAGFGLSGAGLRRSRARRQAPLQRQPVS